MPETPRAEISVFLNLESYRSRIAAINEDLYKRCTSGDPGFFIGPDEKNRPEYDFFCHMRERDFRALSECLDPFRTWFRAAPIKRSDFFAGLQYARSNSIPMVSVSTLEFDYWLAVNDVTHAAPEIAGFMFGLEPWFIASIIEHNVEFKEILFMVTSYCRASYIFNLMGIESRYGAGSCLAMLRSNFRLSNCYANPLPSGRYGQLSAVAA